MVTGHSSPSIPLGSSDRTKRLWDIGCLASLIGIWPRFIEPNLLFTTRLHLPIAGLPEGLQGLKIAQFSDLHLNAETPDSSLDRLFRKVQKAKPDLIVFTGDFMCYSKLREPARLKEFLQRFEAPMGCFAVFGNHDYSAYVAVNRDGDYDIIESVPGEISKGFKRIFHKQVVNGVMSPKLAAVKPHAELTALMADTPFRLLENETVQTAKNGVKFNISGVGEYMANRCDPAATFRTYDKEFPGIVLAHNPDCLPRLAACPGDLILCGHVHGGQVNIPWIRGRFVVMENPQYIKGTFRLGYKWVHINRGLGGAFRFRFCAVPELTLITLERA